MDFTRKAALFLTVGCVVTAPVLLSACASGGGGSTVSTSPPASPPPPPASPPPSLPTIPSASSAEYLEGGYLSLIKASGAYNDGGTGAGILVADVDTGADPTQPDLIGAISPLSTDIVTVNGAPRDQPVGADPHADYVSSVLGARYNGFGTLGVAFDVTILSIRADTGSASNGTFQDVNTAAGIEYAITNHAQVINLSLGGTAPASSGLINALQDAVNAGIAITVSAGNGGPNELGSNPEYPGAYASDPRFSSLMIVAGATDSTGKIASFSNLAGASASNYLVADGVDVLADCTSSSCEEVSGTSFTAPQVAGAIALLLQTFPNLTTAQAVSILLSSADNVGASSTYGRGLLDLTAAFAPMGTLSIPTASGGSLTVNSANLGGSGGLQAAMTTNALGDAVRRSANLMTVGYDSYHRMFKLDLGDGFQPTAVRGLIAADPALHETNVDVQTAGGAHLSFASGGAMDAPPDAIADRSFSDNGEMGYTQVEAGFGALSLAAWRGQGGAQPDLGEPRDAFQSIAAPDQVEAARISLGHVSLSAEAGTAEKLTPFASSPTAASSYARFGATFQGPDYSARIAVGSLNEPLGPLGSLTSGTFAEPSATRFVTIGGEKVLFAGASVYGEASFGRTQFAGDFLKLGDGMTSSWRVGFESPCAANWAACSSVGFEVAQPLRFESGDIVADLANVPAKYFDPLTFTVRQIGAAPSGREVDLRLFADRNLGAFGVLRLEATAASDEGNVAGEPIGLGLLGSWRVQF